MMLIWELGYSAWVIASNIILNNPYSKDHDIWSFYLINFYINISINIVVMMFKNIIK